MRTRLIHWTTVGVVVTAPFLVKALRDRAVERNRAQTPWFQAPQVRFDGSRPDTHGS